MRKNFLYLFILIFSINSAFSQREIVVNTTGYGFDPSQTSGIEPTFIPYLNSLANLTSSTGQDASVTCVRLYVDWTKYEPTLGDYKWQKLRDAVDYIYALKPNMKVALHFPYQRGAVGVDNYLSTDELARLSDGTIVGEYYYSDPSVYSSVAKTRFYNFVDNALSHLTDKFNKILFITMGNNHAEEFSIPALIVDGKNVPGFYENRALEA
ncbi:MAG: hypothetical protein J7497_12545, partial [Chitinophagaceae bacterium]|nr:hypothetical protein [Chitinophagaceae bacterium]